MTTLIPQFDLKNGDSTPTGAVNRAINLKLSETISVKDFGATGNGTTDDTDSIQNAINYVFSLGGGVVYFPNGIYVCNNVEIKSGVTLTSLSNQYGYLPANISNATLKSTIAGWTITTPVGGATSASITGINFQGAGLTEICGGINILDGSAWMAIKQCDFNNYSEQAIKIENNTVSCVIEDILTTNVVLNKTRAAYIGGIDINGTDHFLSRIEANTSSIALSSASYYICGIKIQGANHFISNCIGEFSDLGIAALCEQSRFVNCRADTNFAHGFEAISGTNIFTNCLALNNGLDNTNTYYGFNLGSAQGNILSACSAQNTGGTLLQYAYYDNANYSSVVSRNIMIGCQGFGYGTALCYTNPYLGSGPLWNPTLIRPNTGTTIDVSGTTLLSLEHASPTSITNFTGGTQGQTIRFVGGSNITLVNSTNIITNTGANITLAANKVYTFTNFNGLAGAWIQNA